MTMHHPNGYMMNHGQGLPAVPIPTDAKHSTGIPQAESFTGPKENVSQLPLGDVNVKPNLGNESGANQPFKSSDTDKLGEFPILGAPNASSKRLQSQRVASHSLDGKTEDIRPEEFTSINEEQHALMLKRQEKVARIMRYSGVMNPKDKDFVTRFQLSQIVTDDPYNEDFYAQVYRVIHPKSTQVLWHLLMGNKNPILLLKRISTKVDIDLVVDLNVRMWHCKECSNKFKRLLV